MNDELVEQILAEWQERESDPRNRESVVGLYESLAPLVAEMGPKQFHRALMGLAVKTAMEAGMDREEFLARATVVLMGGELRELTAEESS